MAKSNAMRISYLPVNMAWAVTWGLQLIAMEDRRLWDNKADLVAAVKRTGLSIMDNGELYVSESAQASIDKRVADNRSFVGEYLR